MKVIGIVAVSYVAFTAALLIVHSPDWSPARTAVIGAFLLAQLPFMIRGRSEARS